MASDLEIVSEGREEIICPEALLVHVSISLGGNAIDDSVSLIEIRASHQEVRSVLDSNLEGVLCNRERCPGPQTEDRRDHENFILPSYGACRRT